ncbi:DNA-directed RNA polymerase II subunit GRINL1A-like [Portunus trituberculatus]|uniref:Uncharacterized protein n=1 Tax=Portunus trituberculatus TaxID=210409 RepID=A0A5B7DJB1_PORTR|nr:DNA-directed RNA polymerase II subunit GRINL1A-like [Portunus trituberculatus]MPC21126.1 hypothetical protein [Portunus trituberculatus]
MEVSAQPGPSTSATEQPPVLKLVNRTWKILPDKGDDVFIRDPKLKEGQIGDLSKKSIAQLEEIIERQDRILNNKFLSSKLKDKGEKLKECREIVAEALQKAREQRKSESRKDIPTDVNALEWKSRRKNENKKEELDSDDDEDECEDKIDPLKLMAYHSSCVKKPARTQNGTIEEDEDPTDAIARELRQLELQDAEQEPQSCDFGDKRNQIFEEMRKRNGPVKDSFKPFRPIDNPQPIPGLVHHTARPSTATTKTIPQQEALKLEREFLVKEKERALSNARQQLGKIKTEKIGLPPPSSSLRYRDTNVDKHLLDSEDESDDSDNYSIEL